MSSGRPTDERGGAGLGAPSGLSGPQEGLRTALLTCAALVGFAANSLLCRMALGPHLVDASTFTSVRLISGALALHLLARGSTIPARVGGGGSWGSASALFAYAAAFSFAYLRIGAGVGALLLFGSVQATMLGWGLRSGERLRPREWAGLALALGGLFALFLPGLTAPDPWGAALMVTAGVAWGVYSLRGRRTSHPLAATAGNFARSVPMAVAGSLLALGSIQASSAGVTLAAASGAIASGVGYSLWYTALPGLSAARAAIVQLSVPVLAATGGVALLGEAVTLRLLASGAAILGGVALAVLRRE